jgi:soluble lytic murein transglycosylase
MNASSIAKYFFPFNHAESIAKYSKIYNVDPILVSAVIKTESNFDIDAKSKKNAYGLMQITPETARWIADKMNMDNFSLDMLMDSDTNIKMGCWYLSNLKKEFNNTDLALAAYNAGRGNVQKWLKDPKYSEDGASLTNIPFPETDKYIAKVKLCYKIYSFLYY